jgi:5-formyltetrahydrofolate cyclo-ligase
MSKKELRQKALTSRRSVTHDELLHLSGSLAERLMALPEYLRAKTVCTYVAMEDEVQTQSIIGRALAEGKKVLVPVTNPKEGTLTFSEIHSLEELAPGHFGLLEPKTDAIRPVSLSSAEVVLVPVVAWDERGYRLGYGKGYYDRALTRRGRAISIGLALESQREGRIPETKTDVPLDIVVTEARVVRCGEKKK